MWGEGEIPLLHLTEKISEDKTDELSSIGNIAYRVNGEILTSRIPNMEFADLSSKALRPDYSDFSIRWTAMVFPSNMHCYLLKTVEAAIGRNVISAT